MGLFNKAKDIVGEFIGPKPGWDKIAPGLQEPYEVSGNDHVAHVQKKLDALEKGNEFKIVLPEPNQLQIDYDSPELPKDFNDRLLLCTKAFCATHQMLHYVVTRSMSGNLHVTITLPFAIEDIERVAWQSVFGSDPMRDALSLMSIRRHVNNPVLFIEKKGGLAIVAEGTATLPPPAEPQGRKFRD